MAEGNWSVIRVEKISAEGAQKTERHNERKNESYANLNVDTEQIARNVPPPIPNESIININTRAICFLLLGYLNREKSSGQGCSGMNLSLNRFFVSS